MARILIAGSVATDEVYGLRESLREGGHMEGYPLAVRMGGSAANTGAALAAAGHHVSIVCPVGDDDAAAVQLDQLRAVGIDTDLVTRIEGPSTRSILFVDPHGERTIVNVARAREAAPPDRLATTPADIVLACTRGMDLAGVLARAAGHALVVAHIPPCEAGSRPAHVLVGSASDLTADQLADPIALGRAIAGDLLRHVVITQGAAGATVYGVDGAVDRVPAPSVTPIDTVGAGDGFTAGLAHGLASGLDIVEAAAVGCAFGAEATRHNSSHLPTEAVARLLAETGA